MIEIQNLTKKFDDRAAVIDLSLNVPKGEIFAFLGPNGAGKTTTIKMLTGLLFPTAGSVLIAGHDMRRDPLAAKKHLSYVPDQPYLYDKLTGWEFLEFVGRMYGMPAPTREKRISQYTEYFEMTEYNHSLVEDYSHGMKQKVVLAAAFMHEPEVLVIDEPMVGLDPKSAKSLKELLLSKANDGMTVFMSTHTLPIAQEVAHRIGIIHRGKLIALGSVSEILKLKKSATGLEDVFLEVTEA